MATDYKDLLLRGPPGPNEDLLLRGNPDPNSDMVPLAPDLVPATPKDRITKALQRAIKPQMDVLTAFTTSLSGKKSFGEVFNQMQATEIKEKQLLLRAANTKSLIEARKEESDLSRRRLDLNEREFGLAEKRLGLAEEESQMRQAAMHDKRAKALWDSYQKVRDYASPESFMRFRKLVENDKIINNAPFLPISMVQQRLMQLETQAGVTAAEKPTTFQNDMNYLINDLGMTEEEALNVLKPSRTKGPKALTTGEAYNALLEYKAYRDAGQPVPPSVTSRAQAAAHILKQKKFFRDPDGNLMAYTPGIPEGFPIPPQGGPTPQPTTQPTMEAPAQEQEVGTGSSLEEVIPKSVDSSIHDALAQVSDIADLLLKAREEGETVTGIKGYAKRQGGGLARQFGISISPMAEDLQRKLDVLKALVHSPIMKESRLSDQERKRLDKIVGDVSPTMDEVSLSHSLAEIVDLLEKALGD